MSINVWGLGIARQSTKFFCACLCLKTFLLGHVCGVQGGGKKAEVLSSARLLHSQFFSEGSHAVQSTAHSPVHLCVCRSSVAHVGILLLFKINRCKFQ